MKTMLTSISLTLASTATAKCPAPDVVIDVWHNDNWFNVLDADGHYWWGAPYTDTLFIQSDDSVRIWGRGADQCSPMEVWRGASHWSTGLFGFEPLVTNSVGTYSIWASGDEDPGYHVNIVILEDDGLPHSVTTSTIVTLGGALRGNGFMMGCELVTQALLPLNEPYTAMGLLPAGSGGETIPSTMLSSTAFGRIVDWVIVDLRSADDSSIIVQSRCCLLWQVGTVTNTTGSTDLDFNVPNGSYRIGVRHRNHLGIVSSASYYMCGGIARPWYVFDSSFGTIPFMTSTDGTHGLWPGNVRAIFTGNRISYAGQNNDRDPILQRVGGSTPANTVTGYFNEDVNLDGVVKYVGANNDRDLILNTVGGVANGVRTEQVP